MIQPAAIQAMIFRAIGIYESLFSDPITIEILFRYSDSAPAPSPTPFPPGVVAASLSVQLHCAVERFHQSVKSGCNNQQRQ